MGQNVHKKLPSQDDIDDIIEKEVAFNGKKENDESCKGKEKNY